MVFTVSVLYANIVCIIANTITLMIKQDVKLREAVALFKGQGVRQGVDWVKVSSHMGGTRSSNQCGQRWHDTLKLVDCEWIKKGDWAKDEVRPNQATT